MNDHVDRMRTRMSDMTEVRWESLIEQKLKSPDYADILKECEDRADVFNDDPDAYDPTDPNSEPMTLVEAFVEVICAQEAGIPDLRLLDRFRALLIEIGYYIEATPEMLAGTTMSSGRSPIEFRKAGKKYVHMW
jgi:hypothetical protein